MGKYKIKLLPHWNLTDDMPAFYDLESKSAIGMVSRLYMKMQEVAESYNAWVDDVNSVINKYDVESNEELATLKSEITKICHDYIKTMDIKIDCQNREIGDLNSKVDRVLVEINNNLKETVQTVLDEMKQTGEFNSVIITAMEEVNNRLLQYEEEINKKFIDLQADIQETIDSLKTYESDMNTLKGNVNLLQEENKDQANDLLTIKTNYNELRNEVDSLNQDNELNKTNIESNTQAITENTQAIEGNTQAIEENTQDIKGNTQAITENTQNINVLKGDILYVSGTDSTLRKNIKNYNFLKIFYNCYSLNKNRRNSTEVYTGNLEEIYLGLGVHGIQTESSNHKFKGGSACFTISGTTISREANTGGSVEIYNQVYGANNNSTVTITCIIGYNMEIK